MRILFLLLLSINVFSQDYKVVKNIEALRKGISAVDGSIVYVSGYRSNGDGGGGVYVYSDTSRATDDGGAIIKSKGLQGAWIHEAQNKIVNLKWWGIRPLSNTGTVYNLAQDDIAQEFKAALKFIQERAVGSTLVIEAGQGGVWNGGHYYCSDTWLLDKPGIFITGTKSAIGRPTTRIIWDAQKLCIKVPESAKSVSLEHLEVSQINNGFNWGDSSGHGIYSNSALYVDNLSFLNLAGDAIRIIACAIPNDPNYGNADHSVLKNVWANYTNNGLHLTGCDVNKVTIEKLQVSNIRRWGVWDMSFLGNDYKEPHFAYCGYAGNNNPTTVGYGGKKYTTRWNVAESFVNVNKRPDLHPEIWLEHGGSMYAPEWVKTKRYWSGGPYAMMDDNAWHMIMSPYTEDAQSPSFVNTRTKIDNGTRGSQTVGGSQDYVLFGTEYHTANHVFPKVLTDQTGSYEMPQAPIHAVQDSRKSGMQDIARFESMSSEAWVKIKNTSGDGYLNLNGSMVRIFSPDGNWFGADAGGLYIKSLGLSTATDVLTYDKSTGKVGYRPYNSAAGPVSGASQASFDGLLKRIESLEASIAAKSGKAELKLVADALQALTNRFNNLTTITPSSNPQLKEIFKELQSITNRLNNL